MQIKSKYVTNQQIIRLPLLLSLVKLKQIICHLIRLVANPA